MSVTRLVTVVEVDVARIAADVISVSAVLSAELDDGRLVPLLTDRGWSTSGPADIWTSTPIEEIEATARVVVGPDEPSPGQSRVALTDAHWGGLSAILHRAGHPADGAALRQLPHDVHLGSRLRAQLGTGA